MTGSFDASVHVYSYIYVVCIYLALNDVKIFQVSQGSEFPGRHYVTTANRENLAHLASSSVKIPQLDGPIPDPYDDVLSTPNVSILISQF